MELFTRRLRYLRHFQRRKSRNLKDVVVGRRKSEAELLFLEPELEVFSYVALSRLFHLLLFPARLDRVGTGYPEGGGGGEGVVT